MGGARGPIRAGACPAQRGGAGGAGSASETARRRGRQPKLGVVSKSRGGSGAAGHARSIFRGPPGSSEASRGRAWRLQKGAAPSSGALKSNASVQAGARGG
jgi:hypothetical protein